jgi:hypothetical protein
MFNDSVKQNSANRYRVVVGEDIRNGLRIASSTIRRDVGDGIRTSVARVIQPIARRWVAETQESFACREETSPCPDCRWNQVVHRENFQVESGLTEGDWTLSQPPQIELADAEGFFAGLVWRLVREGRRSACNLARCCHPLSLAIVVSAKPTSLFWQQERSVKAIETASPNPLNESVESLLAELAHRQAEISSMEERSS